MIRYLPLGAALLLACAMYVPAIPSGLFSDDYAYLLAVREMGFGEFVQAAVDPTSADTPLHVPGGYWRPLSALSWQVMAPVFGTHGSPYHLLLLAIHLFGVTTVWFLARRIAGGTVGPAVAALLFALHPANVQAVAWASSVNSVALPLALAAWLAVIQGMEVGAPARRRWLLAAACLFSVALLFRETIAVIGVAASLWYVAVNPPPIRSLTSRKSLIWASPILAMAIPVVVYLLASTVFFTHSNSGDRLVLSGGRNWGFYLRYVGMPIGPPTALPFKLVGAGVGLILLLAIPAALLTRRAAIAALLFAFVLSLGSYSFVDFGVSIRYLYVPLALLGLALALFLAEVEQLTFRRSPALAPAVLAGLCLVAIPVALYGNVRVQRWVSDNPDQQDAWLEQVTTEWPQWPHEGGRLFVANTPSSLALFGGFALPPAVEYVYDGQGPADVIVIAEEDIPKVQLILTEQDEIFVFGEDKQVDGGPPL